MSTRMIVQKTALPYSPTPKKVSHGENTQIRKMQNRVAEVQIENVFPPFVPIRKGVRVRGSNAKTK